MNTKYIQIKSVLVKLLQDQQFLRNLLVAYFEISKVNAFRKGSHIKPKQRKFQVPGHNLSAKCIDDFYSSRVVLLHLDAKERSDRVRENFDS